MTAVITTLGLAVYLPRSIGAKPASASVAPTSTSTAPAPREERQPSSGARTALAHESEKHVESSALSVLDSESGEHIDEVSAVPRERALMRDPFVPDPRSLEGARTFDSPASPSLLQPGEYWVTAPGYRWLLAEIGGTAGERILLARAAIIRVEIQGAEVDDTHDLALTSEASGSSQRVSIVGGGEHHFTHLGPGRYSVALKSRDRGSGAQEQASAQVEAIAGEVASVVLSIEDVQPASKVSVSGYVFARDGQEDLVDELQGVVLVPREVAPPGGRRLSIRRDEGLTVRPESHFAEWAPTELYSGEYEVLIEPHKYSTRVTIPPTSEHLVSLELPAMRPRTLRFVDPRTGEGVAVQMLAYKFGDEEWSSPAQRFSFSGRMLAPGGSTASIRAADGSILFLRAMIGDLGDQGLWNSRLRIGRSDTIDVPIYPSIDFTLVLRRQGRELPVQEAWWTSLALVSVDGSGEYVGMKPIVQVGPGHRQPGVMSRASVLLTQTGEYRVQGPGLSGEEHTLIFGPDPSKPVYLDL